MSTEQLTSAALALPFPQRVSLAQTLWANINAGLPAIAEKAAVREAARRDAELTIGKAKGRSHVEVMRAAKKALGCG